MLTMDSVVFRLEDTLCKTHSSSSNIPILTEQHHLGLPIKTNNLEHTSLYKVLVSDMNRKSPKVTSKF